MDISIASIICIIIIMNFLLLRAHVYLEIGTIADELMYAAHPEAGSINYPEMRP